MSYSDWEDCEETTCRKCKSTNVEYRIWESSDGAFEDYNYRCKDCHTTWWVDGIDS